MIGRLGLGPAVGHVGLDLLGHRLGLDPVERVEGAHERQVELVLDHVARQPRQPVVGVHRRVGQPAALVGAGPGAAAMRSSTPAVNSSTTPGSDSLGRASRGPAGTWWTRSPGSTSTTGGQVGRPGPGEHVAGDAGAGQGRGQLADVDVHAAAVARAGLGQGRGVQGQDGEPAHGGQSLPAVAKIAPGTAAVMDPVGLQAVATRPGGTGGSVAAGSRRGPGRRPVRPAARALLAAPRPRARAGTRGRCARGPASAPR